MLQGFEQRYVKNAFPFLYFGFNESLKGVKMKYKVISFIVHELEPKNWVFGDGWTKPNIDF